MAHPCSACVETALARDCDGLLRTRRQRCQYGAGVTRRIWSNAKLSPVEGERFAEQLAPHELVAAARFEDAEIAVGQPEVESCLASKRLAWVHLTSAGWDRFDQPRVQRAFVERGVALTTSAAVYSEPCAQHVVGFMLAEARQLPRSLRRQLTERGWAHREVRAASTLLGPQTTVVLVGFGKIAARIAALLAPFGARVIGVRRAPSGAEPVPTVAMAELPRLLPEADHVVDILPGGPHTQHVFDATLFGLLKPGAVFYNIGRGSTVEQGALLSALESGRLRAAYLDVTEPEPLPPEHPLWRAPNCTITPHAAGGHVDESARLVAHLLQNLTRFAAGNALLDRVI